MSHPDPDAWSAPFQRLYDAAAAKPNAVEDHPWEETVFKVGGKIFLFLGRPPGARVTVKPLPEDREGLLQLPHVEMAPYVGRYGWVTVTVEGDEALALALDLLDDSYTLVAAGQKRKKPVR